MLPTALLLVATSLPQDPAPDAPRTVAEASGYQRTSTHADVLAFLEALEPLPHASRLTRSVAGESEEGREIVLVTAADPPVADPAALADDPRLRILVNANIHAGEVEGKEAVQAILRELALGEHGELLAGAVLLFVPIYNADGNERIDRANRVSQNGPDGGVGVRPNANGLDLNRDFVKAESAECRTLLGLFRRWDPHLFMDLHTTNGSYHGYHLTYSPSLSTNIDPELDDYARGEHLEAVRAAMLERHGFRVFDYGNFTRGEERRWATYDHRPRFGTNYYSLRNRLAVLSEAYSYLDYEARVAVTHAFVLENLRAAVGNRDRIRALCAAADARATADEWAIRFGSDTTLAPPRADEVLVGSVDEVELEGLGTRRVASEEFRAETMGVQDAFASSSWRALPWGWALPSPDEAVRANLLAHGLRVLELDAATEVDVSVYATSEVRRAQRPFQGHHEITLEGAWRTERRELPKGTWIVPARQRLARVAAQLLEAESEDSLSTWNFFEGRTRDAGELPVLRLEGPLDAELAAVDAPR